VILIKILEFNLKDNQKKYSNILASSIGECMAVLVRNPFELIKQNMQVGNYDSIISSIKAIKQREGFIGFYRGYFTTIMREIPFSVIQFPLYEKIKREVIKNNNKNQKMKNPNFTENENLSFKHAAFCGSLAGSIAATITTPIDVVKTKIMTYQLQNSEIEKGNRIINTVKMIYNENRSLKDFFKGFQWRVLFISVGGICFFGTNEQIKKLLGYKH